MSRSVSGAPAPLAICSVLRRVASETTPVDEEYVDRYTERALSAQSGRIDHLRKDIANWINGILDYRFLDEENIFRELQNGALLCRLAREIALRASRASSLGLARRPPPAAPSNCFEGAAPGSFFARDNIANFIRFCRSLGVHQNLMFETDDLVGHAGYRNVTLCLAEVARLSAQNYSVELPDFVERHDIRDEEDKVSMERRRLISWQFGSLRDRTKGEKFSSSRDVQKRTPTPTDAPSPFLSLPALGESSSRAKSPRPKTTIKRFRDEELFDFLARNRMVDETGVGFDEMDKRVELAVHHLHWYCRCSADKFARPLKIKKIGQARYCIAGRNFFVRQLKNCRLMVRVGGGWDTLDNFLRRLDPCQNNDREPSVSTNSKKSTYLGTFKKILRPGESAV